MEKDSIKNHMTLSKTNFVSKYTLSVQKLRYLLKRKYNKGINYFIHVFEEWINKFETSQKSKLKKIIKLF